MAGPLKTVNLQLSVEKIEGLSLLTDVGLSPVFEAPGEL